MNRSQTCRDGLAAGAIAALAGGAPSTLHALATRRDPLASSIAAGALVLPRERRRMPLVVAGAIVHVTLSLGWGIVLARLLPLHRTVVAGALAGVAVAALDLGLIGRRSPPIRALRAVPQLADHIAYGAIVGAVVAQRRLRRGRPPA